MATEEFVAQVEVEATFNEVKITRQLKRLFTNIEAQLKPLDLRLTTNFKQVEAQSKQLANNLKSNLAGAFNNIGNTGKKNLDTLQSEINQTGSDVKNLTGTLGSANTAITNLGNTITQKAVAPLKDAVGVAKELATSILAANQPAVSLSNTLSGIGKTLTGISSGGGFGTLVAQLNQARFAAIGLGSNLTSISRGNITNFSNLLASITAISTTLTALFVKQAKDKIPVSVEPVVNESAFGRLKERLAKFFTTSKVPIEPTVEDSAAKSTKDRILELFGRSITTPVQVAVDKSNLAKQAEDVQEELTQIIQDELDQAQLDPTKFITGKPAAFNELRVQIQKSLLPLVDLARKIQSIPDSPVALKNFAADLTVLANRFRFGLVSITEFNKKLISLGLSLKDLPGAGPLIKSLEELSKVSTIAEKGAISFGRTFEDTFQNLKLVAGKFFSGFIAGIKAPFTTIPKFFKDTFSKAGGSISEALGRLPRFVEGITAQMGEVFRNGAEGGIIDFIKSAFTEDLFKKFTIPSLTPDGLTKTTRDLITVKTALGDVDVEASRLSSTIGRNLSNAISAVQIKAVNFAEKLSRDFGSKIIGGFRNIGASLKGIFGEGGTGFAGLAASLRGALIPALEGAAAALGTLAGAATVALGVLAGLTIGVGLLAKAIVGQAQSASTLNESINATAVLLGGQSALYDINTKFVDEHTAALKGQNAEITKGINAYFKLTENISRYGITQNDANKALASTIPLLKNAGLGTEDLSKASVDLLARAIDLGSVFDTEVNQVLQDLGSGIRGETEVVRKYGIVLDETTVKQFAYTHGLAENGKELTENQKQLARYGVILEQTKGSQGDFADTFSGSLANQQRVFRATISEFRTQISAVFLPAALKISQTFLAIANVVGPLVVKLFEKLRPAINAVASVFQGLVGAFVQGFGIITTLGAPVFALFKSIGEVVISFGGLVFKVFGEIGSFIFSVFKKVLRQVANLIDLVNKVLPEKFDIDIDTTKFRKQINDLGKFKLPKFDLGDLKGGFDIDTVGIIGATDAADAFKDVIDAASKAAEDLAQNINDALTKGNALVSAQEALNAANERVGDIDAQINKLKKDRLGIQNNELARVRELQDALGRVRDIDNQIRDALQDREQARFEEQRRIDEFQPTLDDFGRRNTLAEIALRRAKDRTKEAQDALNASTKQGVVEQIPNVDLSGLSLDQARAKLAQVRATLALQRQQTKSTGEETGETKTKQQLQDDLTEAQISEQEAALDIRDLERERGDFIRQNTIDKREFDEAEAQFAIDQAQRARERQDAQVLYNQTLRGEIGTKKEIADLTAQITALEDQRKDAADKVAIAEKEVAVAIAEAKGDQIAIVNKQKELLDLKFKQLGIEGGITTEFQKQLDVLNQVKNFDFGKFQTTRAGILASQPGISKEELQKQLADQLGIAGAIEPILEDLLTNITTAKGTGPNADKFLSEILLGKVGEGGFDAAFAKLIDGIISELIRSPGSNIKDVLISLLKKLFGLSLPGLARGGLVKGAPGPKGSGVYHLGEYGRDEAVLPIQHRTYLEQTLSDTRVLSPILAALPKVVSFDTIKGLWDDKSRGGDVLPKRTLRQLSDKVLASFDFDSIAVPKTKASETIQQTMMVAKPVVNNTIMPQFEFAAPVLPKVPDTRLTVQPRSSSMASRQEEKRREERLGQVVSNAISTGFKQVAENSEGGPITIQVQGSEYTELTARRLMREIARSRKKRGF